MSALNKQDAHSYTFGTLKIGVRGWGVFFGGEFAEAAVNKLNATELKNANAAAWKAKRATANTMRRCSNFTTHGCEPYDRAACEHYVAEWVCKATWQRMCAMREAA